MSSFKGQHLSFLLLLCSAWVIGRIAINSAEIVPDAANETLPVAAADTDLASSSSTIVVRLVEPVPNAFCCKPMAAHINLAVAKQAGQPTQVGAFGNNAIKGGYELSPSLAITSVASASQSMPSNGPVGAISPQRRRLIAESYAYSFWRNGNSDGGLAEGGQYGGGQSGFVTTFELQPYDRRNAPQRFALLVRATIAHDEIKEREVGFGVRWRPVKALPVSITAERRLRHDRADAFALYAAGGVNAVDLPLAFKLEGFAQTGVVGGKDGGAFFDGFVRADRDVARSEHMSLHLGAGSWAGGQRGAARVDVGPSIRSDIDILQTPIRITADWRFRIAGDARPGNGLALTLSTGF